MTVVVYTQPGCKNCVTLKEWLEIREVEFEERLFNTEVQTEMIMKNLFDDPPFLEVGGEVMSSGEMFDSEGLLRTSASVFLLSAQEVDK